MGRYSCRAVGGRELAGAPVADEQKVNTMAMQKSLSEPCAHAVFGDDRWDDLVTLAGLDDGGCIKDCPFPAHKGLPPCSRSQI